MTIYYHTTLKSKKSKIVESQHFNFSKFDTSKYLEHILSMITPESDLKTVPFSYPRAPRQALFMGQGIYALESYEEAETYQSSSRNDVISIEMKPNISIYDMDDKNVRIDIVEKLKLVNDEFVNNIRDEDSRKVWQVLINLLLKGVYTNFKDAPQLVGIVIHILRDHLKIRKDVYSKEFYVKLKDRNMRYILIRNRDAILKIS